ncbi:MAG: hypothetical protein V4469_05425 [Patescibacteria group bacterium]
MSKKTLTTFFVGFIIGSVSLTYATWTAPTAIPPNGNTAAPINVSNLSQDKLGVLTVGGLGVFGPALITSTAGYVLPATLSLGVNGKVGATAYCDEKGSNCVTTLGGTSGSATSGGVGWTSVPLNDTAPFDPSCVYRFHFGSGTGSFYPSAVESNTLYWNISEDGSQKHYIRSDNKTSMLYKAGGPYVGGPYTDIPGGTAIGSIGGIEKDCR